MGNDQATLLQKHTNRNRLNAAKYIQISAKHNKKIIHKNLKVFKEFSAIIKSIYVRTMYLKYDWAIWLCTQLKRDSNKLYEQYTQMFTLSLMKKDQSSENFHIKYLNNKFMHSFENNAKKLQSQNFSMNDLQKLFQEVKCYFMVQNWFFDLPLNNHFKNPQATWSSNAKQNEHKGKGDTFFALKSCEVQQTPNHPQKIYRILMKLAEIYFINNFHVDQQFVPNQCESPKQNPMKRFNPREYQLIKRISRESSFEQRQRLIFQLLDSIFKFDKKQTDKSEVSVTQHKKLYALTRVLGSKNVYCVLKVLIQIGSISQIQQIESIFNYISKNMLEPINKKYVLPKLQDKISPNKNKAIQSPQKIKNKSKIKTQFIR